MTGQNEDRTLTAISCRHAADDLERIVRGIAARYIARQVPLTWRLLHAIEAEALADPGFASRHEPVVQTLFARTGTLAFPESDEVVDFGQSDALPAVFGFALAAYEDAFRAVMPQVPPLHAAPRRSRPWCG